VQVVNPATGEVAGDYPDTDPDALSDHLAAARAAQARWADVALGDRQAVVERFAALLVERREALAALLTAEMGKPIGQARSELIATGERIDFFVDRTGEVIAEREVHHRDGLREVISAEPLGVVASVSAWNYPWFVGTNVFVPALLCGNAVLYKPSELVAGTGTAMAELWRDAGLPEGLFTTLVGGGALGAALVDAPVDGVFFTGSYPTGHRIAEAVAGRMIPLQLELGGKDPAYVTDDVDVAVAAAALADGAFYNAGQSCCAVERIYVHHAVHDAFVEAFVAEAEATVTGDPTEEATRLGPLARPQQLGVLDAQLADARRGGARVLTGGAALAGPGAWFPATVVVDCNDTMALMREESFGPVIGIAAVADDDEAAARMADTVYGLTAGVFCRDEVRARAVLARVPSGSAYWNCCDRVSPRLPWSGRGHSGIGVTLSDAGIAAFTRPRAWHLRAP
jgi:acyl-CoA reductase-like NAD-dependent aldehyde dehydrogenase